MHKDTFYVRINPTITARVLGTTEGLRFDPYELCPLNLKPEDAENYAEVDMSDVKHLVLDRKADGSFVILQASGFSFEKGLFTRLYD